MFASSGMIRRMTSSTYGSPFLKYCGWRVSTICCSTFQSCSTKGPVPSAALLRSPCRLIPASLMMKRHGDLNKAALGTGPFVLQDWKVEQQMALKRNPQYFKKGLPYLDEVILRIIP